MAESLIAPKDECAGPMLGAGHASADAPLTGSEAAQAHLVCAFSEGRVDGAPAPVERIDTHLNHVFLTGSMAYKLKRAVRFPFVDFASLDQRRAACEAELSVNRALGSPFYLDVAPVSRRADGGYSLAPTSDPVEWVVVMKRFDASTRLDLMAREGRLTIEHTDKAARRIASMHAGAKATTLAGHVADYRGVIRTLQKTETQAAAAFGLEPSRPSPFDRLDVELVRIGPLIERRRASGKVRRGHGDLHLRNLSLFEGEPTPFDALEFDERLATTDVLYDLAFFLMDLRLCGLRNHANAAMNAYWDEAGEDEQGLQLLPFFTSLRAAVRMAVCVAEGGMVEAQAYRDLAFELLDQGRAATLAIGGLSGSGKTTVARAVAAQLSGPAGARILRSDVLRKKRLGIRPEQRVGGDAYGVENRREIYCDLAERAAHAGKSSASVIADATFGLPSLREAFAERAPGFRGYWLEAPLSLRLARIADRRGDASDADGRVAASQEDPGDLGPFWRRVDARRGVEEIAADILADLA